MPSIMQCGQKQKLKCAKQRGLRRRPILPAMRRRQERLRAPKPRPDSGQLRRSVSGTPSPELQRDGGPDAPARRQREHLLVGVAADLAFCGANRPELYDGARLYALRHRPVWDRRQALHAAAGVERDVSTSRWDAPAVSVLDQHVCGHVGR